MASVVICTLFVKTLTVGKSTVLLMESITHLKIRGMPCFDVNTKLGTAMKVSLGRPVMVNNFLTTLNIKLIANINLKKMEACAGEAIKKI
ncbi:hypothetical protein DPMN_057791 [Dreissena polymorpha]|uniref:Uncharacterized protein n=1 Tax=Dreissena polymorpha TaxID=45954 RepID=A0A9D4HCK6_DREPO|nr:hypothetical protein DPMN_057791 [Dreissena polymorpha]